MLDDSRVYAKFAKLTHSLEHVKVATCSLLSRFVKRRQRASDIRQRSTCKQR